MRIVSSVAREIIFLYVYLFVHFLMFAEYKRRQPSLSDGSKQLSVRKLVRIKANDIVIKADGSQYSESADRQFPPRNDEESFNASVSTVYYNVSTVTVY